MMKLAVHNTDSPISPIEDILEDARNGRPYILVDAEDRENEGDIVIPAQFATPDQINFMIRYARGLVCLAVTGDRARQLRLPPMAADNRESMKTAFTVSIEAKEGVTTGISAADRSHTIQVATDPTRGVDDIVSPGHIFPLVARDGGVLVRAGHTEAAVDISRMAGLNPSGVICEIIKDDGEMARMPDLIAFAQLHGLKIGTIADLIAYRRRTERFVERVLETPFESVHGGPFKLILYRNTIEGAEHIALVRGDIDPTKPTVVRMHQIDFAADLLGHVEARQNYIPKAMQALAASDGPGVVVFLRDPGLHGLAERLGGADKPTAVDRSLKAYGVGAQILLDLGVKDMIVMSSTRPNPTALEGYGLRIVGWRDMDGEDQS
ncbi:3,4-dihydroxy-2-butanone-4-phosphate synthase [Brevundimonas bullata]|jgi:3,4-dihydroxy 2-butanone 4-phosphate synthase/GTP cyclohydrolase II|uniref:3,4-dihydroxy-2-butanone 4-phosphate synthase n=2 Tax=Brevundimonas TaxID=41275 RepID=A0A7W7N2W2_9CAUL|nr:3,4-dihydroxy-2-butanone-4-phosphate synthase [Brevundimonas bullata]MBB4797750.1 3,4-dihydroxy 2-butanone 4-phosphate synthase/GTP cyclohydrolase II [Brevundimonas bullata]MBB6382709.1 3,4-dihydroxy 2-butanone 4-phosphate synthase/GTP cyclohydrolase II [Brevundimonas bullata]MBD3833777.1 3,4-dihydroxy-2-butanone-4-phosphate synthase [Brevundimonas sp.]WQE38054.1 3,4-dihydroxy-2-butanone-4-phosphate synthase [Brevundimonas bullata]